MVEVSGIPRHRDADIREARDDQARLDGEGRDARRGRAQLIDHRLRLEDAAVVGERREGDAVQFDAEMRSHGAHEFGVHGELAVQLELEVGVMAADREGAQQHGRRAREVRCARTRPTPRWRGSSSRVVRASIPRVVMQLQPPLFEVMRSAARRAVRSATSSRKRFESRRRSPPMN